MSSNLTPTCVQALVTSSEFTSPKPADLFPLSGDKDDDDDDDADDKMQSSVLTGGEEGRQESQEQGEVDHSDFEMVVSKEGHFCLCVVFDVALVIFTLRQNWQKNHLCNYEIRV